MASPSLKSWLLYATVVCYTSFIANPEKCVCDGFVMKLDCLSSKQFTYQAANQISHILVVTGHVGSKNLLEQSFNVCSEGTFLWGYRASIRCLVVSLRLLCTIIEGPIIVRIRKRRDYLSPR